MRLAGARKWLTVPRSSGWHMPGPYPRLRSRCSPSCSATGGHRSRSRRSRSSSGTSPRCPRCPTPSAWMSGRRRRRRDSERRGTPQREPQYGHFIYVLIATQRVSRPKAVDAGTTMSEQHHPRRMGGRDPNQEHRAATPLELLFDLTFATSFGLAASQFAHILAAGHLATAVLGFGYATFAICWAWVNFSWFSSAYDTDDWIFRIVTMVQMIGVLILTIGLPRMYASIERGEHIDNSVMVLGYVVMRLALVFQWLRAATQDRAHRRACLTYATAVAIAQLGWVAQLVFSLPNAATFILSGVLLLIELLGPVLGERKDGGTPWHARHIVERHALFATIALGEGIVGTVAALSAVVAQKGWTIDAALVGVARTALTFGIWWIYYLLPSAQILKVHRSRAFVWGFAQIAIVTSIVAT